jgi:glycosyltransferase involved in cell wall biosynthesis
MEQIVLYKIIHVLNNFLPHQTAGTEVYTYSLCNYLETEGLKVKVVIPNRSLDFSDDYFYEGIEIHRYAEPTIIDRKLIMGFRKPDGLNSFKDFLDLERADIVHFHELAGSNGIGIEHILLAKASGAKVIMTFHLAGYSCKTGTLVQPDGLLCEGKIDERICGSCYLHHRGLGWMSVSTIQLSRLSKRCGIDFRKLNHPLGTLLGTAIIIDKVKKDLFELVDHCDQVVCLTNWYEEILLKNGIEPSKISVIKQGLPYGISKFNGSIILESGIKPLKLMFLGRISAFKGLHLLIEALTGLEAGAVELSIYGNSEVGDYESDLRKKTIRMTNVNWLGKLNQPDVISTMAGHDVLCLCSTFSEMSPLVIQEAKAAGIPVLASNVYGNAEQIKDGVDGLLFDFNNVESLKIQINRLIQDRNLLKQLKNNTREPRSFEEVGKEYLRLYNKVLAS